MRPLRIEPAGPGVPAALREALSGGPALFVAADRPPADLPETVDQRVALVVETSGSTGRPRRVALSADAVLANATAGEAALGAPGEWLLALPVHYIAGLLVVARGIANGIDHVPLSGGFSVAAFVETAARMGYPDRYVSLVPAQLGDLLDDAAGVAALRRFAGILVGGQRTPERMVDAARAAGVRIVRTYGSSETAGGCVYDGRPVGQARVRIEDGEVWIGGPTLAEGYLGDPGRTSERFVMADGERWFRTDDAGELRDGVLRVSGRRDDVIISGGIKVSLGEVERMLREHPGFADAVVVAGPHPRWGETPVAFTASTASADAAVAAIGEALGAAARPAIRRLDAIPTLPSGKPDRRRLVDLAGRPPAAG